MEEVKTFQPKTTPHLPTLLQLYPGQVPVLHNNTTQL